MKLKIVYNFENDKSEMMSLYLVFNARQYNGIYILILNLMLEIRLILMQTASGYSYRSFFCT